MNNLGKVTKHVGLAAAIMLGSAGGALAAGTGTGVEAGFFALATDLQTILSGAGGFVVLILSIIIGAITLAVTGRWTMVMVAFGTAVFLGYGVTTLTSLGGVTATADMLIAVI
ncbi:hypothetical protein A9Q96_09955 [Rhodobacterales bacterium 52_120_T64]|nr:hypothetical protein A9Q96_09955 [Rhodobacterales bacterium 52_120_T64]